MFSNKLNYKIINFTALMLLLYIGFSNIGMWWNILAIILKILAPFIIAFAFAYALRPIIDILMKKGLNKKFAVLILTVTIILIIFALIAVTLPLIYDQLITLSKTIMKVSKDLGSEYNINLGSFQIKVTDYLNSAINNIGNILSTGTISILNKSLDFLGKFIVGFIAWIYFITDMDKIRETAKELTMSISKKSFSYFKCIDDEIGNYIKGLTIFMVIQFIEYSFLFWIVGHPNWLLLGILACLTTVIPYFGGLITNIIGIITALVASQSVIIGTIIICLIFPQLDGYVISPRIYGKTNNVNPLITIIAVFIGGRIAGVIGIIAALPTYLLIRSTYHFFKSDLKESVKNVRKVIKSKKN